jgi:hypothetical protein
MVFLYKLKISAAQVEDALATLQEYVRERAALLAIPEGADRCAIDDALTAIRLMDALYSFKDEVADRVKSPAEKAYDVLRFTVVPKLMDSDGVTTVSVAGVGRVNLQDDVAVSVAKEDKDALHNWLIANDLEDMITKSVNAQTLAAFARRRVKEGEPLPEVMKVKPLVRAVITRAGLK